MKLRWTLAFLLLLGLGCSPADDEEAVDEGAKVGFSPGAGGGGSASLAQIPITVGPREDSFSLTMTGGPQFNLADATNFSILLTGCATGWTTTATAATPSLDVYIDDSGCLAKLTQYVWDTKTYVPATDFTTWQADDTAIFENNADSSDTMEVRVVSTLDNPVSGTEAISYYFYEIENGGATTILEGDVGDPHALTVGGQSAPDFTVYSVTFDGVNGTGGGQFTFRMECGENIASNACGENDLADISYKLVEDTYSSTMTLAEAKTLFGTVGTSVTVPGDVIAVGAGGTTNGGFDTSSLDGPDQMHNNPNMMLVLRVDGDSDADLDNDSFTYFNIDVEVLSY